jgi:alpha-1,6-mannosyltransferase
MPILFEGFAFLLGFGVVFCLKQVSGLTNLAGSDQLPFQVYCLIANLCYLAAVYCASKSELTAKPKTSGWHDLFRLGLVAVLTIAMARPFVGTLPRLSDDFYRYFFEGFSFSKGINPYAIPPGYSSLQHWAKAFVNHSSLPALYPPLVHMLYSVYSNSSDSIAVMQAITGSVMVISLLAMYFICLIPLHRIIIWVWCPLVVMESVWSLHVDCIAGLLLAASVGCSLRARWLVGSICMSLGIGIKFFPALFIPALALRVNMRRHWLRYAAVCLGMVGLFYLPFFLTSACFSESAVSYARHWEFNGSLYSLLVAAGVSGENTRVVLGGIGALALVAVFTAERSLPEKVSIALLVILVVSPTVYPWYVLWLAPLAPLVALPLLPILSLLMPVSYFVLYHHAQTTVWALPWELLIVEWGGILLLIFIVRVFWRVSSCQVQHT